jgi:hypothetical protein
MPQGNRVGNLDEVVMRSKISNNSLVRAIQNTPLSRSYYFSTSSATTGVSTSAHIGTVVPPSPVFMTSSWNEVGRIHARSRTTWNYRDSLVVQKSFRYRYYGHVIKQKSFTYELGKRLSSFRQSRFRTLSSARCFSTSRFNTLFKIVVRDWSLQSASPGAITTGIVHPIDFRHPAARKTYFGLTRTTVYPVDYQFNPTRGLTPSAGIQYRVGINPSGRVTCTKALKFSAMNTTVARKSSAFSIDRRFSKIQPMLFNIYNKVTATASSSWIVGPRIPGHVRQMAQIRTDFAY